MKKDVVIGCIDHYNFDQIKYWVNSLNKCGFDGEKIIICYNIDYSVVADLIDKNYKILYFKKNDDIKKYEYIHDGEFNICLHRFFHIWQFFNFCLKKEYRYLIFTDVKDVIFQLNPSNWLEKNLNGKKINVVCESIKYKDEIWGRNNIRLSFGETFYELMKDKLIFNAGTISGDCDTLIDLFINIYMFCGKSAINVPGGGGPDQAALNILLNLEPYKYITNFSMSEDGYAAQLGTTIDPTKINNYIKYLVEPMPIMIDDLVCTSKGNPFYLVHQYDRVPDWKQIIQKKYK